jgi:hypothetical protein
MEEDGLWAPLEEIGAVARSNVGRAVDPDALRSADGDAHALETLSKMASDTMQTGDDIVAGVASVPTK